MQAAKVLIGVLLVIFSLSTTCLAADADDIAGNLSAYAQAKALAASYAAAVKEQYLEEKHAYEKVKDTLSADDLEALKARITKYLAVKLAYQKAAADFEGWRAVVELAVIDDAAIPDKDVYYHTIGRKALASYNTFASAAADYLLHPLLTLPRSDSSAIHLQKSVDVEVAVTLFKEIIFPAVNMLQTIRAKNIEIQNKKRETLLNWLDKYTAWDEWDKPDPPPHWSPNTTSSPPAGKTPSTSTTTTTTTKTTTE